MRSQDILLTNISFLIVSEHATLRYAIARSSHGFIVLYEVPRTQLLTILDIYSTKLLRSSQFASCAARTWKRRIPILFFAQSAPNPGIQVVLWNANGVEDSLFFRHIPRSTLVSSDGLRYESTSARRFLSLSTCVEIPGELNRWFISFQDYTGLVCHLLLGKESGK